jgi:uroporphyrinogen-III synthase
MGLSALQGYTVGITADRRWHEQAELLERRGATVVHGPTMATEYLGSEQALAEATRAVIQRPPHYLVATTGIGVRAWFEATHAWGLADAVVDALDRTEIIARGPKAAAALNVVGLTATVEVPSARLDDAVAWLCRRPLAGTTVALQEYGEPAPAAVGVLEGAGATVVTIPVYRWHQPAADDAAARLVTACCDGAVDAVTFTSGPAVTNLFDIAERRGLADRLRRRCNDGLVVACVGPVCADHARRAGVDGPVAPDTGRLGLLVRVLTDALGQRRRRLDWNGAPMLLQGTALAIGDHTVELTRRESLVLSELVAAGGVVVPKTVLARRVWGPAGAAHSVEVTVARLRQRLGSHGPPIVAVRGRGYRLGLS